MTEQAVIVDIDGAPALDLDRLEPELTAAAATVAGGEYDGHEIGPAEVRLYLYAHDADALADAVMPVLERQLAGAAFSVRRRYGPPGAPDKVTPIGQREKSV